MPAVSLHGPAQEDSQLQTKPGSSGPVCSPTPADCGGDLMRQSNRLTPFLFTSLAALTVQAALAAAPAAERAVDPARLDKSVPACQDFYQYANGTWLAQNTIPADYPVWGV